MASFPYKPVAQLLGSNGPIHAVAYSASPGTYILTGSADRSIRLYNPSGSATTTGPPNSSSSGNAGSFVTQTNTPTSLPAGRLIQTYTNHGYEVLSLSVAADNARFASAGGDRTVFLWDVATGQTTRRFAGHGGRVNAVCFAGAGDCLVVSGGVDAVVRIWDTRQQSGVVGTKPVQAFEEARDAISAIAVPGGGGGTGTAEMVVGSVDGRVRSYDVRTGRVTTDVLGASVTGLCLTRDGRAVLTAALDSSVRLMDRETGACLRAYADARRRNEELRVQAVLGGGERFVVAGDEMTGGATAAAAAAAGGGSGSGAAGGQQQQQQQQRSTSSAMTDGKIWAWDLMTGKVVAEMAVSWGPAGGEVRVKKVIGRDGKEKQRRNVVSCLAWRERGFGDQFCAGGTSGVVTVFGPA